METGMIIIIDGPTTYETMIRGCRFLIEGIGWFKVKKEEIKKADHIKNVRKEKDLEGKTIEVTESDPELVEIEGLGTLERESERFSFSMFYDFTTRKGYVYQ